MKTIYRVRASKHTVDAPAPGPCAYCARPLVEYGGSGSTRWRCSQAKRNPELADMRRRAPGAVRFGSEAWEWLGGKLGLDPDDPRLPEIALDLARAGRLLVFLQQGRVIAVAKAPDGATSERARHSLRFRKVSTRYPRRVAEAYQGNLARAAADSDEEVAATVEAWERGQGIEPCDWQAVGAEERGELPTR